MMKTDWRKVLTARGCIEELNQLAKEDAGAYCRSEMTRVLAFLRYKFDLDYEPKGRFGSWLSNHHEEPCLTCSGLANKDVCPDCGGTGSFWCDSEGEMRTLAEMQAAYQIQRAQKEKEA